MEKQSCIRNCIYSAACSQWKWCPIFWANYTCRIYYCVNCKPHGNRNVHCSSNAINTYRWDPRGHPISRKATEVTPCFVWFCLWCVIWNRWKWWIKWKWWKWWCLWNASYIGTTGVSTLNLGIKPKEPPMFHGRANDDVTSWVAKVSDFFYLIETIEFQ